MTTPLTNQHLASFPRLNPNPVFELDHTGKIIFANKASRRVLKLANPHHHPDIRLFLPPDLELMISALNRIKNTKHLYREITIFNHCFAEDIFLFKKLNVIRIYARDVTKRKQTEEQRNHFLSMIGHELKTPLTSIKAFEQIAGKICTGHCNSQVPHYLKRIDIQVDRVTNLVNDILDFSRLQTGKFLIHKTKFSLNKFLKEIVNDIQTTVANNHQLELIEKTNIVLWADPHRIGQVVINLLTNAIKYSPDGSKIIISSKKSANEVIISVKDFGIGIAPEYQSKLFDPYIQVNYSAPTSQSPSLGLGLYISSQIIKRHHGRIWVDSVPKKGSTFYFSLPITPS